MQDDPVLVLDCQGPNGLALCRSLGKKGISVTAGGCARFLPGMLSKYTDEAYVHPDATGDPAAFVDHLEAHLERESYAAVFAVTDTTTSLLSRHKERLAATGTRIGVEDWETFLDANDKGRLFEIAADLDVPSPRTWTPDSMADVAAIDDECTGRVVIKPRRTTTVDDSGQVLVNRIDGANYVDPDEDLVERFRALVSTHPSLETTYPLVQEYVEGEGTMATVGLADDGEVLTFFQHEKYRVYPPSGGIGAVRKGVYEPTMLTYTNQIIEALSWTGPFHVEFMQTPDGDFALLEVNGRYWGSLALTINSGVDIPWYHYQLLTGQTPDPEPPAAYQTDIRQRKLFYQDLRWLHDQLTRRNVGAIIPFLASFGRTRDEYLRFDDFLPLLGLFVRTLMIFERQRERGSG